MSFRPDRAMNHENISSIQRLEQELYSIIRQDPYINLWDKKEYDKFILSLKFKFIKFYKGHQDSISFDEFQSKVSTQIRSFLLSSHHNTTEREISNKTADDINDWFDRLNEKAEELELEECKQFDYSFEIKNFTEYYRDDILVFCEYVENEFLQLFTDLDEEVVKKKFDYFFRCFTRWLEVFGGIGETKILVVDAEAESEKLMTSVLGLFYRIDTSTKILELKPNVNRKKLIIFLTKLRDIIRIVINKDSSGGKLEN